MATHKGVNHSPAPVLQLGTNFLTDRHPFNGFFSGQAGLAGTREVKPIWILMKQEMMR